MKSRIQNPMLPNYCLLLLAFVLIAGGFVQKSFAQGGRVIPPPPPYSEGGKVISPEQNPPGSSYNPKTGQNMFWDCNKKSWIDSKTGEKIPGGFEGRRGKDGEVIPPPPPYSEGGEVITPEQNPPGSSYNPKTRQEMYWDPVEETWRDSKTGKPIPGGFKGRRAKDPCPPAPDTGTTTPPKPTPTPGVPVTPQPSPTPIRIGLLDNTTDIFLGFAYVRAPDEPAKNLLGFNTSVFYNINQNVAVGGDFTAAFGSQQFGINTDVSVNRYLYLFGPQFSFHPNDKVKVFVHPLFGGVHDTIKTNIGTTSTSFSANAFAMAFGGGVDLRLNDRVAVRPFQLDYIPTRFGGTWQNNYRFSTGFVFRFGKK